MRLEDMTPDVRQKARKLAKELCSMAGTYKGVDEKACAECESPCVPGRELLKLLGLETQAHARIGDVFEPVSHSREHFAQKIINSMNRRKP